MRRPTFSIATFAVMPKSRLDLENLAESYLQRIFPRNLKVPTPLDVPTFMDSLEDHYGVIFGVVDLPTGEEGFTDPITNEILIDTQVYQGVLSGNGRDRHTCCHEAGHIQHIPQVRKVIRDGGPQLARRLNVTVPAYRDPEWQAHGVGSALLMPRTTAPSIYKKGSVSALVEFFQVSHQHALVRVDVLRRLGEL